MSGGSITVEEKSKRHLLKYINRKNRWRKENEENKGRCGQATSKRSANEVDPLLNTWSIRSDEGLEQLG